ncbi:MAG: DNA-binding response regulator, AraC family [uncultured Paraburkholderia sp.]|nr:MAG: DNA-binding response regulator, AraC family [uncultured Paraburkholderia sp.]CAH2803515.1 MAG: DNA-binding response regulator, AraC family [uncultured Paraburkholderia sp.]CAH2938247.1 MAG: DNA-binding response regulator, AraC family [uncultured Paraburkholderia sp.]CAH2940559.1 MAG: DNA-binding response regulator, AraC family [uncultured Paraburkholderia sp.]
MPPLNTALAGAHLLVVDDQPDQLRLLIDVLRNAGCRISVGFDGSQAYQRALAISPDLILMDVRMPRMDGFAACRLLAADPRTSAIPVIFLTVAGDLDERLNGLEIGAVDYVLKPFDAAGNGVLVRAAIQHLSQRLNDPPTVEHLARLLGTNEKRLSRAFRENLGQTVFEYLREERLRVAQTLLSTTPLSIASIAEEIGFSSAANFATAFRERFDVTPSTYREEHRIQGAADSNQPAADAG